MKIFCATSSSEPFDARVSADSAMTHRGEPFFIPDEQPWSAQLFIAGVVSRLGKNIEARFARRYYDALCLMAHPGVPGVELPYEYSRDNAILAGDTVKLDSLPQSPTITLSGDAQARLELQRDCLLAQLDALVEHLSAFHTLRTGDLVALPLPLPPLPMSQRADFRLNIDDNAAFHLKAR